MKIKKLLTYMFLILASIFMRNAEAVHCTATTGTVNYPFQFTLTAANNTVGYSTDPQQLSSSIRYSIAGDCTNRATYYSGTPAQTMTMGSTDADGSVWYNLQDNNYLQVSSQIAIYNKTSGTSNYRGVPFTDISNNCDASCLTSSPAASGSQVKIKLRIKKRFIGSSFLVNEPIAYLYGNQGGPGMGLGTPIVQINLNASLSVNQTCTLNAGTTIEFNFGSLNAQSFKDAGAGQKLSSAKTQTKNISIKCNDIAAQSTLTLRLEASNIKDNIVVSDNPDVGFQLANSNGVPLVPNDNTSNIPFKLDDNYSSNVTIQSWPVSVTGKLPSVGSATAAGYLRADFQ
ncbi:fimbrial protein [Rosenbergiella metrosideri]|uniref:fimbrial protein n=2 Tax=Rosenbergiella TaxID=1356488 RepID=UPI001F503A8F|nr:fimbrial protein [Rosenbergiella metrosideri]